MKRNEKTRRKEIPWPKPGTLTTFAQPTSDHLTSLLSSIITIIIFIVTAKWVTYNFSHSRTAQAQQLHAISRSTQHQQRFFRLKGSMKALRHLYGSPKKYEKFFWAIRKHIHHQFYFLYDADVVIIVKLSSTDISRFLAMLFSTLPSDMHSKEVRIINEQVQRMVDCAVEFSVSAQLASLDLAPSDGRRGIRVWRKFKDLKIWEIIRWQPYTAWISDPN